MKTINKILANVLVTFGIALWCNGIYSQGNNNTISFAPRVLFQFGGVQPLPTGPNQAPFEDYDGSPAERTHAAIQDENGDLLFFVVDGTIYDREGYLIQRLTVNDPAGSVGMVMTGVSETLIVPDPFNCNRYYIFAVALEEIQTNNELNWFPFYTVLDLSLDSQERPGRKGAIDLTALNPSVLGFADPISQLIPNFFNISGDPNSGGSLKNMYFSAPKKASCSNRQFVYLSTGRGVFQLEITPNGVVYNAPKINFPFSTTNVTGIRAEMEAILLPDETHRIAVPYFHSTSPGNIPAEIAVFYADFDTDGNLIPNSDDYFIFPRGQSGDRPFINGLEFSPSGDLIYFTHNVTSDYPTALKYFDVTNSSAGVQNLTVPNINDFQKSQIETNQNGELIFVTSNRIAALANSDNPNAANWTNNSQPLGFTYNMNNGGLNFPNIPGNLGFDKYIIPKQIKQASYSNYFVELGCLTALDNTPITGTWSPGNNPFNSVSGVVDIAFDLVIPMGSNLVIQNMEFRFSETSKLIVEAGSSFFIGARLTLNNTTLTVNDDCNPAAMWPGVEVKGVSNLNQAPISSTAQGSFVMNNNSRIEHALTGVLSIGGGIVQATDAVFYNNQVGANISLYTAPNGQNNVSFFRKTAFITDGLLNDPSVLPNTHFGTIATQGIRIMGCSFENQTPSLYAEEDRGTGVLGFAAQFTVDPHCTGFAALNCTPSGQGYQRSTFLNLHTGVIATNFTSGLNFRVDQSDFINNSRGVFANNYALPRITRNHFEVLPSAAPNATDDTYGIFLNACTGYAVEENYFTTFADPNVPALGNTYGIIVENSGEAENEIYKNDFEDLKVGIQAQGINGRLSWTNSNSPSGLEFRCNRFYEEMITADISVTSGRIREEVGSCFPVLFTPLTQRPAGNLFSYSSSPNHQDFGMNNLPVVDQIVRYKHHFDSPTVWPVEPLSYNSNMMVLTACANPQNPIYYDEDLSCPTRFSAPIIIRSIVSDYEEDLNGLKAELAIKNNQIDLGNTQALLTQIMNSSAESDIKGALMQAAPFTSDTVLLTYIYSQPAESDLLEVLLANAPLSDAVYSTLQDQPLSKHVSQQIKSAQNGISPLEELKREIAALNRERHLIMTRLIGELLLDTTDYNSIATIDSLLNEENDLFWKEMHIDLLQSHGASLANSVTSSQVLAVDLHDDFNALQHIINDFDLSNLSLDGPVNDPQFQQELERIRDSKDHLAASSRAGALLQMMKNCRVSPDVEQLFSTFESRSSTADTEFIDESNIMRIFPNPNSGEKLNLSLSQEVDSPEVLVYNAMGQLMITEYFPKDTKDMSLNLNGLGAGLYFIELQSKNQIIERSKFVVQ